jgi:hypothetical protein
MALHWATVCPGLKVDLPPSHCVLQLQLPSLTLPQFCANAADAKQTAMAKMIVASPNNFMSPSSLLTAASQSRLGTNLQPYRSRDGIRFDHGILVDRE